MAQKIDSGVTDWEAIYQYERNRTPVRQLSPGIDRHFAWEGRSESYRVPIDWLTHYAPTFHFSDEEISGARTAVDMPRASGVYFLFDGDECVYIGQTQNFVERSEQHKRNGMQWTAHAYVEVPKFHAAAIEAYYIRRMRPILNGFHPRITTYSSIVEKLGLDRAGVRC